MRFRLTLLIAASAALYLLGNARISLWDRDEPRYAQTSREMLRSGDWVVPRFLGEIRTAKPVFIYWCQAGAMRLFGDNAFAARLPSSLAMVITLTVLAIVLWRSVGPARAIWTTLVLASSVLVIVAAKAALTDSVLLLWVTIAQLCLYAVWRGKRNWSIVVAWSVAIGLGLLTKGPVILGIQAMTILALVALRFTRKKALPRIDSSTSLVQSAAKVAIGILIAALIVGIWVYLLHQRSPQFIGRSLWHDVVKRSAVGLEGHKGPPGYHLALIWATFLPWSLLIPLAIALAWKRRHLPPLRFALAAIIGPWVLFEIVQTKLPHYMLPVFPALAFLVADALVRNFRGVHNDLVRPQFKTAIAVWGIIIVVLASAPWILTWWFRPQPWLALVVITIASLIYAIGVYVLFRRGEPERGTAVMGLGFMAVLAICFALYLPRAHFLRTSIRVADLLNKQGAIGNGEVIMMDYKEPSLAFYQGGTIREERAMSLTSKVMAQSPRWIVATDRVWSDAPPAVKAQLREIGRFRGLDYADGRIVQVVVLKKND